MLDTVFQTLEKWLNIEDRQGVEIFLAIAIASQFPGDPLWFFLVGPPGSTKTEICRSLKGSIRVYTTDTLTPKALISGFRPGKKDRGQFDLLPQLNGKLLIIKDFTAMLSRPSIETTEIFGTLRGVFDGYYEAVYGSGVGKKSYDAIFGIIAAVTPVIDTFSKVQALLGERFLRLRERYNRHKAIQSAIKHSGQEVKMRFEINEIMRLALDYYSGLKEPPKIKPTTASQIEHLANVTSVLRSGIARDARREVKYVPEGELGTRIAKQFIRLGQALFVMDIYNYEYLLRVARDTIPRERLAFAKYLAENGKGTVSQISQAAKQPRELISYAGEDLWYLGGVVERKELAEAGSPFEYQLVTEFKEDYKNAGL